MTSKPQANDLRHEFMALMERAESASHHAGDDEGALGAKMARLGIDAIVSSIEEALADGADPALIINALARGFGIPLVAALVALTKPGKVEEGVEILIPAITDVARMFAAVQDQRALAKQQGSLFQ